MTTPFDPFHPPSGLLPRPGVGKIHELASEDLASMDKDTLLSQLELACTKVGTNADGSLIFGGSDSTSFRVNYAVGQAIAYFNKHRADNVLFDTPVEVGNNLRNYFSDLGYNVNAPVSLPKPSSYLTTRVLNPIETLIDGVYVRSLNPVRTLVHFVVWHALGTDLIGLAIASMLVSEGPWAIITIPAGVLLGVAGSWMVCVAVLMLLALIESGWTGIDQYLVIYQFPFLISYPKGRRP